jgi:hypothetical protein
MPTNAEFNVACAALCIVLKQLGIDTLNELNPKRNCKVATIKLYIHLYIEQTSCFHITGYARTYVACRLSTAY